MIFDLETYEQCKAAQRAREQQAAEAPPEPETSPAPRPSLPPRFAVRSVAEWLGKRKWEPHLTYAQRNAKQSDPASEPDDEPQEIVRDWIRVGLEHRKIIRDVAKKHGFSVEEIYGKARNQLVVAARQEAMYEVAMAYPYFSTPRLGGIFQRDHSTIYHGVRRHCERNNLPVPERFVKGAGDV